MFKIAGRVIKKSYLQVLALVSSKTNAEENESHSNLTRQSSAFKTVGAKTTRFVDLKWGRKFNFFLKLI